MYRTSAQIESALDILASWFPQYFMRVALPNTSVGGLPISALRMRVGGGPERRGVLITGGAHARELMNPDAIVELALDLLLAHANGTDIVYGNKRFTSDDIQVILEGLDLWLLPCINPDGRDYVLTQDDLWRKNRRDNPDTPCDGVDINRNYGVVWGVTQGQSSCAPCSEVFVGSAAFSEPETQNVKALLDAHRMSCFLDVHSFAELVLYPWGHAQTQTTDAAKRFTTLATGTCAPIPVAGYAEYMDPRDLLRFQTVGNTIVDAIRAVRGRVYRNQASIALYPTTGSGSDYAYSRHIADPALAKTYGYTIEAGPDVGDVRQSFHPTDPTLVKRDVKAGMLALARECVCAIELIGFQDLGRDREVAALRTVRDELLATTAGGRAWIARFDRLQARLLGIVLADRTLRGEAAELLERLGALVADEAATVGAEDVRRARGLLRELSERLDDPAAREDLHDVSAVLAHLEGRSSREAIEVLMRRASA